MHIALLTPRLVEGDGQGRVNVEVAHLLLARGHRLTVLAQEITPALRSHPKVEWVRLPGRAWPTALLRELAMAWYSTRWLRRHRTSVDLILSNGCLTRCPADVNAVHFVHHAWQQTLPSPLQSRNLRAWYQALYTSLNVRWERQAFADARVIVAVSDRIRAELIDAGVSPDRICVIPNGVDPTEFAPGPVPRDALGLPSHVPLALFVGDLQTPRKNLDTVLRALVDVPTLHLAVAGRIDDSPYPSLASTLGLGDRVHFLDFRRDVPALMRAADFTVAPSRYEPFSLVVLESLASERPVITTQNVGAASLLNADCGVVLDDPEDTDALAAALSLLTNAPQRREQMGKVGRAVALQYTWDEIAARYVSLLESMHAPDEVSDERIPSTRAPRPISIH